MIFAIQVGPLDKELWEAEREEDVLSSGYGGLRSSITTTTSTSSAARDAVGTASPETDTGTDFGLLGSYTKGTLKQFPCFMLFPVPL